MGIDPACMVALVEMFTLPNEANPGASMPADQFQAAIDMTLKGTGGIPHLDKDLINNYLTDLAALAF